MRSTKKFLQNNPVHALPRVTETVTGYSLIRPVDNQDYYYGVFDTCKNFNCAIEGWHTETGPGVFEAVRPVKFPYLRRPTILILLGSRI